MFFSTEIKEAINKHKMHLIPLYLFPFYYLVVIFLDVSRLIHFLLYIPVFIAVYMYAAIALNKDSVSRKAKMMVLFGIPIFISLILVLLMIGYLILARRL